MITKHSDNIITLKGNNCIFIISD